MGKTSEPFLDKGVERWCKYWVPLKDSEEGLREQKLYSGLVAVSETGLGGVWLTRGYDLKKKKKRVPILAHQVKNPTSVHEDVGSIPGGLTQWVKDLALLQAVV